MDKVEAVRQWVESTAMAVRYLTHADVTLLLECGPGRVILSDPNFRIGRTPLADVAEVRHIVDWIVASLERGEEWLTRTDDKGRPLKLMKCGTIKRLVHEADKAMRRWNAQVSGISEGGTETVFECSDGFRVVRLTTCAALDAEGVWMGHCVGNGAYDARVESGATEIFSLRNPRGKSHATIELAMPRNKIVQVMGKANSRLKPEYMKKLVEWFNADRSLVLQDVELPPYHATDRSGTIVDLASLKPGAVFKGDLTLRVFDDYEEFAPPIPEGFTVEGDLYIHAHRRSNDCEGVLEPYDFMLPVEHRAWSLGYETAGPKVVLPQGLQVQGRIEVRGCRTGIPQAGWSYRLIACQVESLPCEVDRSVELRGCRIAEPLGDIRFARNLLIDGSGEIEFSGTTRIDGELTLLRSSRAIEDWPIVTFAADAHVGGNLHITDGELHAERDLNIGGSFAMRLGKLSAGGDMNVQGDFRSDDSYVERMPEKLNVGRDMHIALTEIDCWPADMSVEGEICQGVGVLVRQPPSRGMTL
jgi:hypothetical protein